MTQSSPLAPFLRKITPSLAELDAIPLFGHAPLFDWRKYANLLAARLTEESFALDLEHQEWKEESNVMEGMGHAPWICSILLSPIATHIYWVMPVSAAKDLCRTLLRGDSEPLQEGFYRYLLLEALATAKELEPIQQLTPQLSEESHLPKEKAFCIDLSLSLHGKRFSGRLIIPQSTRSSWIQHFSHLPGAPVAMERAKEIELPIGVQIGRCEMVLDDWQQLSVGDAVLLDQNSYAKEEGMATLMLGSIPLFQARVEKNRITILEYAFYYEEPMEGGKHPENEQSPEEMTTIQNYPISIAVELGRLKVTLEQLMQLSAGNILELPIQPDQGISLTVNGRLIGRGELVSFEGATAIRILEIGS